MSNALVNGFSILSLVVSGLSAYYSYRSKERVGRQSAVTSALGVLQNGESPKYLKSLALISLLRNQFIDPDIVLSAAYGAESVHGPGILKPIMYEIAKMRGKGKRLKMPIGVVDLDFSKMTEEGVVIPGWAIDHDPASLKIVVWLG